MRAPLKIIIRGLFVLLITTTLLACGGGGGSGTSAGHGSTPDDTVISGKA